MVYKNVIKEAYLFMAVTLKEKKVGKIEGRVDGVLCGVVITALRLFLLCDEAASLQVSFGLWILLQCASCISPAGLLTHGREVHVTQAPPDTDAVHIPTASIHKE